MRLLLDGILRSAAGGLATRLLRVLNPVEKRLLADSPVSDSIHPPPTFIIGSPRSGSTILYQLVTNCFRVNYISNLACIFFESLSFGVRLHRLIYGDAPFNCFESEHGRTRSLMEPSECGKYWYRWFPRDRHFVGAGEIAAEEVTDIRRTFAAITRTTGLPIVIKNLNCGQRLQVLQKVVPEALFLFCRRDPVATAHSILRAREKVHGDRTTWWSVMPRQVEKLEGLPYPEQIVKQVYLLEKQIEQDLKLFPDRQHIVLRLDDLRSNPRGVLTKVESFFARNSVTVSRRPGALLPELRDTDPDWLSDPENGALRREVERLVW